MPLSDTAAVVASELRLVAHLATRFPNVNFRIEGSGPLSDPDEFTVIPIMNRRPGADEGPEIMRIYKPLRPSTIFEIKAALREFNVEAAAAN